MEVEQLRRLKPELTKLLSLFDDCFDRKDTRAHLPVYVAGQRSEMRHRIAGPMAGEAGAWPRTLQDDVSEPKWDEVPMGHRPEHLVGAPHASPDIIGTLNETSYAKKGDKTPGVKR